MQVNGKDIGEVITLKGDAPVNVQILLKEWHVNGLDRVEVIRNGELIKSFPGEGRKMMEERFEASVDATCWLVAHCAGKDGDGVGGVAYTSPIYLQFGTEPMKPRKEDVTYFLKWLDEYEGVLPAVAKEIGGVGEKDYAPLLALIGQTRGVFQSLMENPRTWLDQ